MRLQLIAITSCGPVVPKAGATRNELTATAAVEGFLKQAFKFSVSFGGQRSVEPF
jgi:hypothetical protein